MILDESDPIERTIKFSLRPRTFIHDGKCIRFVMTLEAIAKRIEALVPANPPRAVALYEEFIAGCRVKVKEVNDSSGAFATFAQDLICGSIKASQAMGSPPGEIVARLLARMDDDPFCFCSEIEKTAVKVLDEPGLAAFAARIRERYDAAEGYRRTQYDRMLRAIYRMQSDTEIYLAFAEETGLTPSDCLALATILLSRRKTANALKWADRGLEIERGRRIPSSSKNALEKLHRQLLVELGRATEARDSAWAAYLAMPAHYTFEALMKLVPETDQPHWREQAITASRTADLRSRIDLYVSLNELDLLAETVLLATAAELTAIYEHIIQPAAVELDIAHPAAAARLWCVQGLRIVDGKDSKRYRAAVAHLANAKRCFERAGMHSEWAALVPRVRAAHYRKMIFMAGFEAIA